MISRVGQAYVQLALSVFTLEAPPTQYWLTSLPTSFFTKSVTTSIARTAAFVMGILKSHSGFVGSSMKCLEMEQYTEVQKYQKYNNQILRSRILHYHNHVITYYCEK